MRSKELFGPAVFKSFRISTNKYIMCTNKIKHADL